MTTVETLQATAHIKTILSEADSGSPTGRLFQTLLESHILEVGRGGDIFQMKYTEIEPLMTESWIKNTLAFTSKHEIELQGNNTKLEQWCQEDSLIMDDILATPGATWTKEKIEDINRCRLYLQVTNKSDITEEEGRKVRASAIECWKDFESTSSRAYR